MKLKTFFCAAVAAVLLGMAGSTTASAQKPTRLEGTKPLIRSVQEEQMGLRTRHVDGIERASHSWGTPMGKLSANRRAADGYVPTIYGTVIFADNWTASYKPRGIYSFQAKGGVDVELNAEAVNGDFNSFCGVGYDGIYHFVTANQHEGTSYYEYNYYEYSTDTWKQQLTKTVYSRSHLAADYTYDATTDKVYGVFPGDTGNQQDFATIDFSGNITTDFIRALNIPQVVVMAANAEGELYVICMDGNLYRMDKATGETTLVGSTGVSTSDYAQSACFDPATGKLYWACTLSDDTSALYDVDITTGRATEVLRFPHSEEITGLYIPAPLAQDDAPAKAENLKSVFQQGSLTGTVSFTVPTTTFGGKLLTGVIGFEIQSEGVVLKSGTTMAGAEVTEQVTLEKGGQTSLVVVLKNDAGTSPVARSIFWAGPDTPLAVTDVQLQFDEETYVATVTWNKTTGTGVNGGYVGEATYDVVRYPGAVTVSTGKSETTFTETLSRTQLNYYYYTVTAVYEGLRSQAATTNGQAAGAAYEVPFFDDPKSEDAEKLPFYQVYNLNGDDGHWGINFMGLCFESSYTATNNADDWLLTPPIHLKPGQSYIFSFNYRVAWRPHRLAVAFGKGSDFQNYTQLMEPTEFDHSDFKTFTTELTVEEDAVYRFGFHALSDGDMSSMYVGSISVEFGSSDNAPDSVTNLKVTPAPQGQLAATLTFNAPTRVSHGDSPLSGISKIDIYRGDEVISTIDKPEPGAALTYTDNNPANGMNEYTVVANNTYGDGKKATVSTWVGFDQPTAPKDVRVKDNGQSVTISWTAAEAEGQHGGYVDPARIRYSVYDPTNYNAIIAEHQTGLTAEDTKVVMDNDFQSLMYYSVFSESELPDGSYLEGRLAFSPYMRIGNPFQIPYRESVANGEMMNNGNWAEANYKTSWYTTTDLSADNDGGCIYFTSAEAGDWAIFHLPKLTLKGAKQPYFLFSYYAVPGADLTLEAQLLTPDYEPVTLKNIEFKTNGTLAGWQRVALPLADYSNERYVIVGLKGTARTAEVPIVVDNMEVRDVADKDLGVTLTVPTLCNVGATTTITAEVTNLGLTEAKDYTVTLYKGTEVVAEQTGKAVKFNETTTFDFDYTPLVTDSEVLTFHAVVTYDGDEDNTNNTSDEVGTNVKQNSFPVANNVKAATAEDGTVTLTWDAPTIAKANTTEDDIEGYLPWSISNIGKWTTYDGSGKYTYNLGSDYPFDHAGYAYAFIVMNPTNWTLGTQMQNQLAPHSGSQYLMSFSIQGATDHWLISPLLSGGAQTVNFFAKSFDADYKESFEILYSTTDSNVESFQVLRKVSNVPVNWVEYSANLPEGAKYFAIRHCSDDCWALCIDDISYEGASLAVDHYNVYRDGQLLGSTTELTYTDQPADGKSHRYQVTVVYNEGESPLSTAAESTGTGIDTLLSRLSGVRGTEGGIEVNGAEGKRVEVYAIDGRLLYSADGRAEMSIPLNRGQYIVRIGGKAQKIATK